MAPKKLVKDNEMEEVKPARVLRPRPQVVTTNVDLDDQSQATKKKVRAKKNVQTTATKATGNAKANPTQPKKVAAKGHKLPEPIKPGESVPDYDKLKTKLKAGHKVDGKLNFSEKDGETGEASGETEKNKKKAPAKKKAPGKKEAPTKKTAATDDEKLDQVHTEIHLDEEALRHVNTAKRRVKEVVMPKEPEEKPKGKNIKEDKTNIPTQALLDVMNNNKNKTTGRKKKPDLNKKKKNPEAGTKENGESESNLEMEWNSVDEKKPSRKKMKDSKNPTETEDSEGENNIVNLPCTVSENTKEHAQHALNETYTIQ